MPAASNQRSKLAIRRCRCIRVDRNGIKFNPKPNDVLSLHTETTPGEDLSNSKILKVPISVSVPIIALPAPTLYV